MSTQKQFPQEEKEKLEALLVETASTRTVLDEIDQELLTISTLGTDRVKEVARKATGAGSYLRKKLAVLTAAVKNVRSNRYMEIKMECNANGSKFTDAAALQESEGYVGPLRTARDILEAYVIGADNTVSFCRMHMSNYTQELVPTDLS